MGNWIRLLSGCCVILFILGNQSCYYDVESELYGAQLCDTTEITSYSQKVAPIMGRYCTSCHGGNSPESGISLENYDGVSTYVNDGRLSCTINHGAGCAPMPDNAPKMNECDILEIERWVAAGALND